MWYIQRKLLRMSRKRTWSDTEFIRAVADNTSISGVLRTIGLHITGANFKAVNHHVARLGLSTAHWKGQAWATDLTGRKSTSAIPLTIVLVENSSYLHTSSLKRRLLSEDILVNRCYICGIDTWQDKPLVLRLDHINGINNDNRRENLRLLCPNCDSQQDTFCGRNIKKTPS